MTKKSNIADGSPLWELKHFKNFWAPKPLSGARKFEYERETDLGISLVQHRLIMGTSPVPL